MPHFSVLSDYRDFIGFYSSSRNSCWSDSHILYGFIEGIRFGWVEKNLLMLIMSKLTFLFSCFSQALVPSILMNIYVVGLNQLFDVEIDKVILRLRLFWLQKVLCWKIFSIGWKHFSTFGLNEKSPMAGDLRWRQKQ